jgi:hypothetical protein
VRGAAAGRGVATVTLGAAFFSSSTL